MLKQSQKRTESAPPLTEALMSSVAGEHGRIVGHDAHGAAVEARESDDNVLR